MTYIRRIARGILILYFLTAVAEIAWGPIPIWLMFIFGIIISIAIHEEE